jgi:hypothetical protein
MEVPALYRHRREVDVDLAGRDAAVGRRVEVRAEIRDLGRSAAAAISALASTTFCRRR